MVAGSTPGDLLDPVGYGIEQAEDILAREDANTHASRQRSSTARRPVDARARARLVVHVAETGEHATVVESRGREAIDWLWTWPVYVLTPPGRSWRPRRSA
jgi:hypothetical protein